MDRDLQVSVPSLPVRPHAGYQHEAFMYRGDREFLAGTVPFVREAVGLGQPVLLALPRRRLDQVREALRSTERADHGVIYVDMAEFGHNPAWIIPGWLRFLRENCQEGVPVRGIGEPFGARRRPEEVVECQLHEALLNAAIDPDLPFWLRCPYDREALPAAVIDDALCSHPALVEMGDYRGSTAYTGLHHVDCLFRTALPAAPSGAEVLPFSAHGIPGVRSMIRRRAIEAGLDADRSRALGAAVEEIATNTVQYGGGHGTMRTWIADRALVCEIIDSGQIDDPLVGRRDPDLDDDAGRGIWLAQQTCDLVQVRSAPGGSAVRMFTWL